MLKWGDYCLYLQVAYTINWTSLKPDIEVDNDLNLGINLDFGRICMAIIASEEAHCTINYLSMELIL